MDWTGIAAVIAAVAGLVAAIRSTQAHTEVRSPNGTKTGESVSQIALGLSNHMNTPISEAHPAREGRR